MQTIHASVITLVCIATSWTQSLAKTYALIPLKNNATQTLAGIATQPHRVLMVAAMNGKQANYSTTTVAKDFAGNAIPSVTMTITFGPPGSASPALLNDTLVSVPPTAIPIQTPPLPFPNATGVAGGGIPLGTVETQCGKEHVLAAVGDHSYIYIAKVVIQDQGNPYNQSKTPSIANFAGYAHDAADLVDHVLYPFDIRFAGYPKVLDAVRGDRVKIFFNDYLAGGGGGDGDKICLPWNAVDAVSHELVHHINASRRYFLRGYPWLPSWLNETMAYTASQVALDSNLSNPVDRANVIPNVISTPKSLTTYYDPVAFRPFGLYLYDQFSHGWANQVIDDQAYGTATLEHVTGLSFDNLFTNWTVAAYFTTFGIPSPNRQYRYPSIPLSATPGPPSMETWECGHSYTVTQMPYAAVYKNISSTNGSCNVTVTGDGAKGWILGYSDHAPSSSSSSSSSEVPVGTKISRGRLVVLRTSAFDLLGRPVGSWTGVAPQLERGTWIIVKETNQGIRKDIAWIH